jgi:hypothetical protein
MTRIRKKWFLAALLVGAFALGLVGVRSVLAQTERPGQHGVQHERPAGGATAFGPGHHAVEQERPHGELH